MDIEEFKAAITNEFALQRIRKAFAGVGLPDAAYSVDRLYISQTLPGDYEGTMELTTRSTKVIINFHMKPPLTQEMIMSVCPTGPPMEIKGSTVHTLLGVFLPSSKRAGSGEKQGQLVQLFDT